MEKKSLTKHENVQRAILGSPDKLLTLGNRKIQCYVLEDGTAVLSGRGMQEALNLGQSHGTKLTHLISMKSVNKYIDSDLAMVLANPIRFIRIECDYIHTEMINYEGLYPPDKLLKSLINPAFDLCAICFHRDFELDCLQDYPIPYPQEDQLIIDLKKLKYNYASFFLS